MRQKKKTQLFMYVIAGRAKDAMKNACTQQTLSTLKTLLSYQRAHTGKNKKDVSN